jgi:chromosome segregation ATPase
MGNIKQKFKRAQTKITKLEKQLKEQELKIQEMKEEAESYQLKGGSKKRKRKSLDELGPKQQRRRKQELVDNIDEIQEKSEEMAHRLFQEAVHEYRGGDEDVGESELKSS